jgi:AraC-like DNA-binding protein
MLIAHSTLDGLALFTSTVAKHQHDRHAHGAMSVIMLTHGAKSYCIEGRRRAVLTGQIAIANPGEIHGCEYIANGEWAHRTWYISADLLSNLSEESGFKQCAEIGQPVLSNLRTSQFLLAAHAQSLSDDVLHSETAALSGLTYLLRQHGQAQRLAEPRQTLGDAMQRVERYKEMMHAFLDLPMGLAQLAKECGVSRFQVIRDFQRVMRISPGDHHRALRMQKAKSLLAKSAPLSEIAMSTGYSDQSHFSRTFRRVYGITPKQYRMAVGHRNWMSML